MEVKDAVVRAKAYISELYSDEKAGEVGLEEVIFDDRKRVWDVTIGFRRLVKPSAIMQKRILSSVLPEEDDEFRRRLYKVVRIDDRSGKVVSLKDRDVREAA